MLPFNTEISTITMEVDAAALLMLTKNNIYTLNSNLTLPTESWLNSTNLILKPRWDSILSVQKFGKFFQTNTPQSKKTLMVKNSWPIPELTMATY